MKLAVFTNFQDYIHACVLMLLDSRRLQSGHLGERLVILETLEALAQFWQPWDIHIQHRGSLRDSRKSPQKFLRRSFDIHPFGDFGDYGRLQYHPNHSYPWRV